MNNLEKYSKIHQFLTGQMTPQEEVAYKLWLLEEDNLRVANEIEHIWDESLHVEDSEFNYLEALQKHKQMLKDEANCNVSVQYDSPKIIRKWLGAIAATLILAVSALFVYQNVKNETYNEQNVRIVLSDGSYVWLDQNSSIKVDFTKKTRNVQLQGKAFFDVSKDNNRPFNIESNDIEVSVVGTSFLVDNASQSVFVKEGKVKVKSAYHEVLLKTNQRSQLNAENAFQIEEINFDKEALWFNKDLEFKNTPLDKVLEDISAYHGVKFHLAQKRDWSTCPFSSGSLSSNSLAEVLDILKLTFRLEFDRLPDNSIRIKKVNCK